MRGHNPYLPNLLPYIPLKRKVRILDVGCGLLPNSRYLLENGYYVISLDSNFEFLIKGRKIVPNAKLVCADLCLLPFKKHSFSSMLVIDVLEHLSIEDTQLAFNEILSVLKNESTLFLHVPLEASLSYRLLRLCRRIWTKDRSHKHDYKYSELVSLINRFNFAREKEWVDTRLGMLKKRDVTSVSVTKILSLKRGGDN